jgi:hypothetical protein
MGGLGGLVVFQIWKATYLNAKADEHYQFSPWNLILGVVCIVLDLPALPNTSDGLYRLQLYLVIPIISNLEVV